MEHRVSRWIIPAIASLALAVYLGLAPRTAAASPLHAGDWLVRIGLSNVNPNDSSSNPQGGLPAGSDVSVNSSTRPSFTVGYMFTDHLDIELLAAWPFKHDITGTGALNGTGEIGNTKLLPPTLSVDWHFMPDSRVRPYAGLGVNYTNFFSENATGPLAGTTLSLDNSWGPAAQAGVDIDVGANWAFNASVRYIQIKTTATYSNGYKLDVDINPWVFTVGIGTNF
jgi:outer membrane protein